MNIILPIARPPWTGLGKRLESLCRKALYDFNLLEGVSKITVALSGGKDSLTLLFLLKAISGKGFPELEIHAVHVGGAFSCGAGISEKFLEDICKELGVNFITCTSTQKRETLACYSCSRERRRLIFEAAKSVGSTTIAFGHHRDDSVQTLLMNLLHKGEFAANLPKVPMHDYGITIIRPLILVSENEIREFARNHGFARILCQCPVGQNSMRKQVESLLKEMEALFPNARQNLSTAGLNYGSQKALLK
ncbi:MAG: tRNA 2-thiocytidine biosynthesis TtcA family protein [Chlamydiota bacterium]